MPTKPLPAVAVLRGSPEYDAALDDLAEAMRAAGVPVRDRSHLAELGFAALAERHGVALPRRSRPVGWNQSSGTG